MSTLVNIVLAVVLNLFSYGNMHHTNEIASTPETSRVAKEEVYQIEDLKSHYVITKEEVIQNSVRVN